jgi:Pyridoxamine 5'-phosphate oxidase
MGRQYDSLTEAVGEWIARQPMFFVATAPTGDDGHVNLSPKGLDTFRVLDPTTVAYLDLTGSGAETIAHLRQNGRITIMFCAFEGPPRILRLFGAGEAVHPGDPDWDELSAGFPAIPGRRAVIRIALDRIADSCGYAVPEMAFVEQRSRLVDWAVGRGDDGLVEYRAEKNARSIDGLPAIDPTEVEVVR